MTCPDIKTCKLRTGAKSCRLWLQFPMRGADEPINAPGTWQWNCAFVWNAVFARNMSLSLIGNQSAVESLRNQVATQNTVLAGAISYQQELERLPDATRED